MDLMRLRERGARRFVALARLADKELVANRVDDTAVEKALLIALNPGAAAVLDGLGAVETQEGS